MNEVRNIGEQMTGPCDMQQNTNSQKMKMPWEEDLQAHDRAVLGI
jgi:hypothetical protein